MLVVHRIVNFCLVLKCELNVWIQTILRVSPIFQKSDLSSSTYLCIDVYLCNIFHCSIFHFETVTARPRYMLLKKKKREKKKTIIHNNIIIRSDKMFFFIESVTFYEIQQFYRLFLFSNKISPWLSI